MTQCACTVTTRGSRYGLMGEGGLVDGLRSVLPTGSRQGS